MWKVLCLNSSQCDIPRRPNPLTCTSCPQWAKGCHDDNLSRLISNKDCRISRKGPGGGKMFISLFHKQLFTQSGSMTSLVLLRKFLIWHSSRHRLVRQPEREFSELVYVSEIWLSGLCESLQPDLALSRLLQNDKSRPFKSLQGPALILALCFNLCAHSSLPWLQSSPCNFRKSLSPFYSSFSMAKEGR